jgi:hypothetical protein
MNGISDGRDIGAFITADLDDFGLDLASFRIYARIVRRAGTKEGCFESIDNMAKGCRMKRETAYRALKTLLKHNLIKKQPHAGKPSNYYLTPSSEWIPLNTYPKSGDTSPIPNGGTPPIPNGGTPPIPNGGTPPIPNGGTPPIPNGGTLRNQLRNQIKEQQQGSENAVAETDFETEAMVNKAANLAKRQIGKQIVAERSRNFIQDAPWGVLAKEMNKDPKEVFEAFRTQLEVTAEKRNLRDPEGWAGKIANDLFQNPGSEANCKHWRDFERSYRGLPCPEKPRSASPAPREIPPLPETSQATRDRLKQLNPARRAAQ